jgi:hypothetical protein
MNNEAILEEEIEVLYNACYGGWSISEKAYELYKTRNNNLSPRIRRNIIRTDPILIQIYHELGADFDTKYSKTEIDIFPKKYADYITIKEYDGLETVHIDYTQYELDNIKNKIKEILQSSLSNDEKINELNKIICY